MTAKKAPQDLKAHEMHTSPFEQITTLENEQEARVLDASERFEQEKRDAEKSTAHAEKTQEEMLRTEATDALKEYARTEPASILKNAEKQTADERAVVAKHAEKELPKALHTVLTPLLDGSLFTAA